MKIRTIDDALRWLTSARWFFEGFAYGRPAALDEGNGSIHVVGGGVADGVREFLAGLEDGKRRTLAPGTVKTRDGAGNITSIDRYDGGRLVISYAELEAIYDGLPRRGYGIPTRQDQRLAARKVEAILNQWQVEQAAFDQSKDDLPF